MQRISQGATQDNLSLEKLLTFEVPTPPLQTQKRIADILSAYDDLIENNLKRIKLLEQAAQNIYKEWFVNLRFPGHENTPINEETGLPVGWVKGTISDFGKVVTGKTPSTKKPEFYGGNMPFIKTPDMHNSCYVVNSSNKLTKAGSAVQSNKTLPKNSVMVSCIGTAGIVAITSEPSQTNQQINSVIFDSSFKTYYFYCFASRLKQLLEGLGSNGATMVNVNKGKFENIEIIIPSEDYLTKYSDKVEPMFNQILTLLSQNQKLKAARDILLPRLMNRTIEV
jgi:type I restriction enzyme S subunit